MTRLLNPILTPKSIFRFICFRNVEKVGMFYISIAGATLNVFLIVRCDNSWSWYDMYFGYFIFAIFNFETYIW